MSEGVFPVIKLPNNCKHISYIKSKIISELLQLSHFDVVDNDRNKCFVPGCQGSDVKQLKTFALMGYPPLRTYYAINYIGLGLYPLKNVDIDDWYTAYIPLNLRHFTDNFSIKHFLLKIIRNPRLSDDDFSKLRNCITGNSDLSSAVIKNKDQPPADAATTDHKDEGLMITPSCMYATKPEISSILTFEELDVKLQILIQIKTKPDSYTTSPNSITLNENFDSCFPNSEIEWYVKNVDDIIAERLLFKIHPIKPNNNSGNKLNQTAASTPNANKSSTTNGEDGGTNIGTVMLLAENEQIGFELSKEAGFNDLKDLYKLDCSADSLFYWNESLILKLRWTEKQNKLLYYLKTLISGKSIEWEKELKVWRISSKFLFETVKFCVFLGLKVESKVLFDVWRWLVGAGISTPSEFDARVFTKWLSDYGVFSFLRVAINFTEEPLTASILPYNKGLITVFKESNRQNYVWDKDLSCWRFNSVSDLLRDLLSVNSAFRESSSSERQLMESKGFYIDSIKDELQQSNKSTNYHKSVYQIKQKNGVLKRKRREYEEDDEFVTKIMITVAGNDDHLQRLIDKVKSVVEKISPPLSSISSTGKIVMGGTGTGGIEFLQVPTDLDTWNQVSMCVVPNEENKQIPVNKYDHNVYSYLLVVASLVLMASLIGDVFIVKESAIDYLLDNFKTWPGPHDSINYTKWSHIINISEPRCWGGLDFDGRQSLAQTGLFDNEDFYISGSNNDSTFVRMLIMLGCGNIVTNPKDAEYVIITDKDSSEAKDLFQKFGNNDEDLISITHGARHSTLVTPKYIYDCILEWKLKRPTHSLGHMAF
uniref:BRCT domain-containing protein n=1 Tax=Theileria annulata TaxID=5874 RepID=A0A3B0MPW6_THEAN